MPTKALRVLLVTLALALLAVLAPSTAAAQLPVDLPAFPVDVGGLTAPAQPDPPRRRDPRSGRARRAR